MPLTATDINTKITTTYMENGVIVIHAPEVITITTTDRKLADRMLKVVTAYVKRTNKESYR